MNQSCVLELSQITYDRDKLRGYYEDTKPSLIEYPYEECNRKWRVEDKTTPVIADIISKFLPEILENIKIIILEQQPGFNYTPHIDYGRQVSIFYPIDPEDAGVCTMFYNPDVITDADWAQQKELMGVRDWQDIECIMYEHEHSEDDVIYRHYYSTTSPTLCNVMAPHGVQNNDNQHRVYMQISIYDYSFEECKQLIKQNRFFA
jgi:hypothetical protein